jgi:hypothetical protein
MLRNFCWRLLAAVLIIFAGHSLLRGQVRNAQGTAWVDRSITLVPETPRWPLVAEPLWEPDFAPEPPGSLPTGLSIISPIRRAPYPERPGRGTFSQIANKAGIIFAGQVVSVGRASYSLMPGPASTSVTFLVEHAMRGVSPGERLTIHEWSGLWARGERYRVGERVVLFLFPPSRLGLTSPVAGRLGRFKVIRGRVRLGAEHAAAFAEEGMFEGKVDISYAEFARAVGHAVGGRAQEE